MRLTGGGGGGAYTTYLFFTRAGYGGEYTHWCSRPGTYCTMTTPFFAPPKGVKKEFLTFTLE